MIVHHWPTFFRAQYGGTWPTSFLSVDCETTGFSFKQDLITEWGHCLVIDGQVTDRLCLVIDWTEHEVVPPHWLADRMRHVQQSMRVNGRPCHMTVERMREEGMKPGKAFEFIQSFMAKVHAQKLPLVLHGGIFDEQMLCANIQGFGYGPGFTFGPTGWLDTEGIMKASQLVTHPRMHVKEKDTLRSYFHRVKYTRVESGFRSSLDDYCYDTCNFAAHGVQKTDLHAAYVDSYCGYLMMEWIRAKLAEPAGPAPVYPTVDHAAARKGKAPALPSVPPRQPLRRIRGTRTN